MTEFETKDSGERQQWASGMQRDVQAGKPRFALMWTKRQPYHEQMLTRYAKLLARGAEKYEDRNWEEGCGQEELDYAMESLGRHAAQLICGEGDEDHAAAVWFNTQLIEYIRWRMAQETEHLAGIQAAIDVPKLAPALKELPEPSEYEISREQHRQQLNDWHNRDKSDDIVPYQPAEDRKRVADWMAEYGDRILDFDGFRDVSCYQLITRAEYLERLPLCTMEFKKAPKQTVDGAFEIK